MRTLTVLCGAHLKTPLILSNLYLMMMEFVCTEAGVENPLVVCPTQEIKPDRASVIDCFLLTTFPRGVEFLLYLSNLSTTYYICQ